MRKSRYTNSQILNTSHFRTKAYRAQWAKGCQRQVKLGSRRVKAI